MYYRANVFELRLSYIWNSLLARMVLD